MIARTAQDYRTEARRLDARALAAEGCGDDLAADRLRRRAPLERRAAEAAEFRAIGGAA